MTHFRSARCLNLREWWAEVAVVAAAVTVAVTGCAGLGSTTADAGTPSSHITDTETETDGVRTAQDIGASVRYPWYVVNATARTVDWGQFCKTDVSNLSPLTSSKLEFGGSTPWAPLAPGERTADAFLTSIITASNFTSGILSIDGRLWAPTEGYHTRFHKTSGMRWDHVWIFWDPATDTPFLTREDGYDDIALELVDSPYGNFNACSLL